MIDFEALATPGIRGLRAYDPGHDLAALRRAHADGVLVELGSNENPCGPSPAAKRAVLGTLDQVHRYPDPRGGELKRALAARLGVDTARIILGNGSHELLMQLAQVFAGPRREVVASQFGFAVYALAAQAADAPLRIAPAFARGLHRPVDDRICQEEDLDAVRVAALVGGMAADGLALLLHLGHRFRRRDDGVRPAGGEAQPARRAARLAQHRPSLRRAVR